MLTSIASYFRPNFVHSRSSCIKEQLLMSSANIIDVVAPIFFLIIGTLCVTGHFGPVWTAKIITLSSLSFLGGGLFIFPLIMMAAKCKIAVVSHEVIFTDDITED